MDLARTREAAGLTYREAVTVLAPDAEGTYFLHRFSDPTFVAAEALLRILGRAAARIGGPWLDLCGGAGHLAHALADPGGPAAGEGTVIADLYFRKLWLATHLAAPGADAVCCSADAPLPFTTGRFAMVVLMDAFPYIWHKRLCADEMMRVARPDGIVALPHLHSSEGENFSAGDPLSPSAYRDLFAAFEPALFSDARLLKGLLEEACVDLTDDRSPDQLRGEPSLTLVPQAARTGLRRRHGARRRRARSRAILAVNPLYRVEVRDGRSVLTLRFSDARVRGRVRRLPALSSRPADRGRGSVRPRRSAAARPPLRRAEAPAGAPRRAAALPVAGEPGPGRRAA